MSSGRLVHPESTRRDTDGHPACSRRTSPRAVAERLARPWQGPGRQGPDHEAGGSGVAVP